MVDPVNLNVYNKSAKYVAICSLQVIKLMRKYECNYFQHKYNTGNEDQKNRNLNGLNHYIEQSVNNKMEMMKQTNLLG